MRAHLAVMVVAMVAAPAYATQTPRYEPAPAWVLPAGPISQASAGTSFYAIIDEQTRIADGAVWSYRELGSRAVSAEALAHLGTLTLNWQPFHGDLIIHRVDIVRDGMRIDVLKSGQTFNVIRREQGLEKLEMNGTLTATLPVEGLRVGDLLDVAYSVLVKDPTLKGAVQARTIAMAAPFKVDFARARMLWPVGAPIRWKSYLSGLRATERDQSGWHELTFALPAPTQPQIPNDAPARFQPALMIEASSFPDWAAVSAVFAPLYDTKGLITPGTALAQEVARIRAAQSDPKRRAAAALSLVQDRIRYFADGLNGGNYLPQSPERTWSAGYGDCKAKTLLLLALLHELGIEAEPVLANIGQGDRVATRLPAPGAFNHILVHAKIAGDDLWLDGTARGSRLEDLGDPPNFRFVLPVSHSGATLVELPFKAPARPTRSVLIDIDESAGFGLPCTFSATVRVRGGAADALRVVAAQLDNEKLLALALVSLGGAAGPDAIPVTQNLSFDVASGTATISVTGIASPAWRRQDHAYRLRLASGISSFSVNSDRSRPAWRDIPVATGDPGYTVVTTRFRLPDGGRAIRLEGDPALDVTVAGRHFTRNATRSSDMLVIEERTTSAGAPLLPAVLPQARQQLASAQERGLRLATDPEYPAPYRQTATALRMRGVDQLASHYAALIAAKPDDPGRYVLRAAFFAASFQRSLALADLDKAVALDGNARTYLARGLLLEELGQPQKAEADYRAVLAIDPTSRQAILRLGLLQVDAGQSHAAVAAVDEHIAAADDDKAEWLMVKAELLARAADAGAALAATTQGLALQPSSAALFNQRCWVKGTMAVQLDSALQDCTRAVELSESKVAELDSRAMVYYRLGRMADALSDTNAALDRSPGTASSLYLRAAIERKLGKTEDANRDAADARLLRPVIDGDYQRWNIRVDQ